MTYCCGILVRDGMVMIADTRTNAGLDNISTFRKLHVFRQPGERVLALTSSGNLSISQSVVSMLNEGIENPEGGESATLMNAPGRPRSDPPPLRCPAIHTCSPPILWRSLVSWIYSSGPAPLSTFAMTANTTGRPGCYSVG